MKSLLKCLVAPIKSLCGYLSIEIIKYDMIHRPAVKEASRPVPKGRGLQIELYGELAALLKLSEEPKTKHPLAKTEGVQVTMVAGARNLRCLHLDFACIDH